MEIKRKVAIIIPCYKAKDSIGSVVEKCLIYLEKIRENFTYKIVIIDDACPQRSCINIKENIVAEVLGKTGLFDTLGSSIKIKESGALASAEVTSKSF